MTFHFSELRNLITFERLTVEQDPVYGYMTETWNEYRREFAKIEPLVGREYMAAAAIQSNVDCKITLRWFEGCTPSDQITHNGMTYNIKSVINVKEQNREMLIYATRNT